MELSRVAAVAAERSGERAVAAVVDPHHVVRAVGDEHVPLLRIAGEREMIHSAARRRRRAPDAAAVRPARLRGRMHEPLPDELPLLGEHLHAIAAALAHIDETVAREMNAVQRRCELHLVRRQA